MRNLKFREPFKTNLPLLVITFDDGFTTDYDVAFKEMRKRGMYGTSYITTNWVGNNIGHMSYDEVRFIQRRGWDVQGHTHTHPRLSNLTETELHGEMQSVDNVFAREGLQTATHHAYPYGDYSDTVKQVLSEYRHTQRRTGNINTAHMNDYDTLAHDALLGYTIDGNADRITEIKSRIDVAIAQNKILVVYGHRIYDTSPIPADYGIYKQNFIEMLDYAIRRGIRVVTVKEMYEMTSA